MSYVCVICKKDLSDDVLKLRSLEYKDSFVCEECAVEEDERWIESNRKNK